MYETSRAIVIEKPRHAVVKEIPLPAVDDQTVVIRTTYSAISTGTEVKVWNGRTGKLGGELWYPTVPGYEQVGVVVHVGKKAMKDANGANLDRIQIVKGWSKRGQMFEKVYNVAVSDGRVVNPNTGLMPEVGSTVDIVGASYDNSIGDAELKGIWRDSEFDPTVRAFYYARVMQIPTPRWSTYDAMRLGVSPPNPPAIQERAWTSPIWYTP